MYDENQLVKVKWANKTRKYFESKGYTFTGYGEWFEAKAKDLPEQSKWEITVTCDYCGKDFQTTKANRAGHVDKTNDACPKCRAYKQHSYTKKDRAEKAFNLLKDFCADMNYELITKESEYTNATMDIKYICPKHGLQISSLDSLIHQHECLKCSYEKRGINLRHQSQYIKQIIESYNNNELLNPEDYIGSNISNLKIKCGLCGSVYKVSFSDYTTNNQICCKYCSAKMSKGAKRIEDFLISQNIIFEKEKTFDECKDKNKLPFDFYLPTFNAIIEFDGEQHFRLVPAWGEHSFELTQRHDKIKNDFCESHNIFLIRIPYNKFNNIESILLEKLNIKIKQIS